MDKIDLSNRNIKVIIDELYGMYKIYGISIDEIRNIVNIHFMKYKSDYIAMKKQVESEIDKLIISKLNNSSYLYSALYSYIQDSFESRSDLSTQMKNLKKISSLLNKFSIIPSKDIIIKLLDKNEKLQKACVIIDSDTSHDTIIDDEIVYLIINTYSSRQNIEKDDEEDSDFEEIPSVIQSYFESIKDMPLLSSEEEKELIYLIRKGDQEAYKKFISANLKLVVFVAKRFSHVQLNTLSFEDLISEGNMGLLKAIERFDPSKGFKFSTYAIWWIRQAIITAIKEKGKMIRIPSYYNDIISKYKVVYNNLEERLGRKPTNEELSDELMIPVEEVKRIIFYTSDIRSLNEKLHSDSEYGEFIPANDDFDDEIENKELANVINDFILNSNLTQQERKVILLRFGFVNDHKYTLSDIGKMLNLTRERIRQIELKALKKLTSSEYKNKLSSVVDNIPYSNKSKNNSNEKLILKQIKFKSIYKYIKQEYIKYIDNVISMLSDDEINILKSIYGNDYSLDVSMENVSYEFVLSFNELIDKIRLLVKKIKLKSEANELRSSVNIYQSNVLYKYDNDYNNLPLEDKRIFKIIFTDISKSMDNINTLEEVITVKNDGYLFDTKLEYSRYKSMLCSTFFINLIRFLDYYSAVIIVLRLGYIDNKKYSKSQICRILDINGEQYEKIVANLLKYYNENVNEICNMPSDSTKKYIKHNKF